MGRGVAVVKVGLQVSAIYWKTCGVRINGTLQLDIRRIAFLKGVDIEVRITTWKPGIDTLLLIPISSFL